MKKLVILTGAGMSAESGISTFRDSDGLWEKYRVEDVATPEGFAANPKLVLDFYNQRRRELLNTKPTPVTSALPPWRKISTYGSLPRISITYMNAQVAAT